jgi:hypothetical protein
MLFSHGHNRPGSRAGIPAEQKIHLVNGNRFFGKGLCLFVIGFIIIDHEFHFAPQQSTAGVDFIGPKLHSLFNPFGRLSKPAGLGQGPADDNGFLLGGDGLTDKQHYQYGNNQDHILISQFAVHFKILLSSKLTAKTFFPIRF